MLALFTFSCKKEGQTPTNINPLNGLTLVKTFSNTNHKIEIYTNNGKLVQGYNKIYFQLKNQDGSLVKDANINWTPMMHMTSMSHSGPSIQPVLIDEKSGIYQGDLIFQMAGNDTEYWDLTFNYSIGSTIYTVSDRINVIASSKQRVSSFKGSDNTKYILALVNPEKPKVGSNDIDALLFRMDNMTTFSPVNNYSIKIDPRMTGMGNHGSPNNVDLKQVNGSGMYKGKLNLTMTGYWKINLQLANAEDTILKGESVGGSVESSSIYFEVEF